MFLRHVALTVLFSGGNPAEGLASHPWEGGLFFLVALCCAQFVPRWSPIRTVKFSSTGNIAIKEFRLIVSRNLMRPLSGEWRGCWGFCCCYVFSSPTGFSGSFHNDWLRRKVPFAVQLWTVASLWSQVCQHDIDIFVFIRVIVAVVKMFTTISAMNRTRELLNRFWTKKRESLATFDWGKIVGTIKFRSNCKCTEQGEKRRKLELCSCTW